LTDIRHRGLNLAAFGRIVQTSARIPGTC
jgi:hypothetical protein